MESSLAEFFFKLSINLPYDSAVPLPGIYLREMKTMKYPHKNLYVNTQCIIYNSQNSGNNANVHHPVSGEAKRGVSIEQNTVQHLNGISH